MPTFRTCLRCLARTWCVNAALSTRGMQELGLLYTLEPGLHELYPDPERRAEALARYTEYSNTHPFLLPLYTGIILSLEEGVSRGVLPPQLLLTFKTATPTTLSAVGDAFFSGSLLPLWVLISVLCVLSGHHIAALWLGAVFIFSLTFFRALIFFLGLRQSLRALHWLRTLNVIDWADRLKLLNAVLVGAVFWQLMPGPGEFRGGYALGVGLLIGTAWCIGQQWFRRIWLIGISLLIFVIVNHFG